MKLWEDIKKAIQEDDANEAIYIVQEAIGQDAGDNASVFFSEGDIDAEWLKMDADARADKLKEYINYELSYYMMFCMDDLRT